MKVAMHQLSPWLDRPIRIVRLTAATLLSLGLAIGCASATPEPGAAPAPAPAPRAEASTGRSVLALKPPEAFGAYKLTGRNDSGTASDGIAHLYSAPPGERWTVYFYKLERSDLGGDVDQRLDAQVEVFAQVLEYQKLQGVFDTYEIVGAGPDPIRNGDATIPGRKFAYVYRKDADGFVSVLFLYAVRDGYVKIRGTVDSEVWARNQPTFPVEFMKALFAQNAPL